MPCARTSQYSTRIRPTLQQRGGGSINPAEFTHGTSAQRQQWFKTGYESGSPRSCDTFAVGAIG